MVRLRAKFKPDGADSADGVVDHWVTRLVQRPIAAEKRRVLIDALGEHPTNEEAVRRMVQLIVSMPEYQLC